MTENNPKSDKDWTVHSLNIQGIFFQRRIVSLIYEHPKVRYVTSEYPVEFPRENKNGQVAESRLDVQAVIKYHLGDVNLIIECKKANPDFVDWIFFPKHPKPISDNINILITGSPKIPTEEVIQQYDYATRYSNDFLVADEARETRGSYLNAKENIKTKTSNASITDASYQVTIATHAVAQEKYEKTRIRKNEGRPDFYIPIIVTTANLFKCEFNPAHTSIATGEIPFSQVELEPIHQLFYEYPIPPHLQIKPDNWWLIEKTPEKDQYVRRHILVVNSNHFEETLSWLVSQTDFIVNG